MAEKEPFSVVVNVLNWNDASFRIDVECHTTSYSFKFWDGNDKPGRHGRAREVIRQMNYLDADCWEGGVFRKEFEYPSEEDALQQYMTAFNNRLAAIVAGQQCSN